MFVTRSTRSWNISAGTTEGATPAIPYATRSGGMVFVPSGSSITTITWYAAGDDDYLPASDADGNAIVQTVEAGKAYQIPDALFGAPNIKPVVDTAGSLEVSTKS